MMQLMHLCVYALARWLRGDILDKIVKFKWLVAEACKRYKYEACFLRLYRFCFAVSFMHAFTDYFMLKIIRALAGLYPAFPLLILNH